MILEKNDDSSSKNQRGETPLMLAASEGHLEIAQLLLRSGASRLIKDRFGRTAWMHAIDGGNVELVKLLA